jgi:hypothetical protein
MDKNMIKKYLKTTFLAEEKKHIGLTSTEKVQADSKKFNKEYQSEVGKKMTAYDKASKSDEKKNSESVKKYENDSEQEEYHDDYEILNGQEMIKYDNDPGEVFKERAIKSIEGHSSMGNGPGANAEATWGASSDTFGKDLIKRVKSRVDKESDAMQYDGMGDVAIPRGKNKNNKPVAVSENAQKKTIKEGLSEKGQLVLAKWVEQLGADEAAVKLIDKVSNTGMVSHLPDSMAYGNGVNLVSKYLTSGKYDAAYKSAKTTANKVEKAAGGGMFENKINENKTDKMKRLKFKKAFNGVGNALQLIPEGYKVDKKEFQMTDGNENYEIRWEGTVNEGRAVILKAGDKTMISENMAHMKHLIGYKSQDTLGTVKGSARLDENAKFADVFNKTKALIENMASKDVINENATGVAGMGFVADKPNPSEVKPGTESGHANAEGPMVMAEEDEDCDTEEKDRFDEIFEGLDDEDDVNEGLSDEQSKKMDTDKDGDIDGEDLKNLRKGGVDENDNQLPSPPDEIHFDKNDPNSKPKDVYNKK